MKLKKSIALIIPLLFFSLIAYADPSPNYIILPLFLGFCQLVLLLIFIFAFIKRFDANDHRANKWIYISSFFLSCFIIRYLYVIFGNNRELNFFIFLVIAFVFFISTCIVTYKKSNNKSNQ